MKNHFILVLSLFITSYTRPETPESLYQLAKAYYTGSGHIEPSAHLARQEARKILIHPQASEELKAKAYFLIGKSYFEELKTQQALENLSKVQSADPSIKQETADMLYEFGMKFFHEKSSPKKRRTDLNLNDKYLVVSNALTSALPSLKRDEKEAASLALGTIYAFGGNGIEPDANKVIEYVQPVYDNPSNQIISNEAQYLLGVAYFYLGAANKDKVIEFLTPIAQSAVSPYKNIANQFLAYTYFNANDWSNAIIYLNRTLQSPLIALPSDDRHELELMLGKAYYHNGQFDDAELILKKQQSDLTWSTETIEETNRILDEIHTIKEFLT